MTLRTIKLKKVRSPGSYDTHPWLMHSTAMIAKPLDPSCRVIPDKWRKAIISLIDKRAAKIIKYR